MPRAAGTDRTASHWKRLGIVPGAPECVIKAAHLALIEVHHPDRGGDANVAKEINAAYDELKGRGRGEQVRRRELQRRAVGRAGCQQRRRPEARERAGKQLASELQPHPRLAERVEWALKTSLRGCRGRASARADDPPPPPPPRAPARAPRAREEPAAGHAGRAAAELDFGKVHWGATRRARCSSRGSTRRRIA